MPGTATGKEPIKVVINLGPGAVGGWEMGKGAGFTEVSQFCPAKAVGRSEGGASCGEC